MAHELVAERKGYRTGGKGEIETEKGPSAFLLERFCAILENNIAVDKEREPTAPQMVLFFSAPEVTMS